MFGVCVCIAGWVLAGEVGWWGLGDGGMGWIVGGAVHEVSLGFGGLRVESLVGLLRLTEAFTLADFEYGGFYEKVPIKTIIES